MALHDTFTILISVFCWALIADTASAQNQGAKHLLVSYWGQNGAGNRFGPANYEKELSHFCINSKFDIINLAFIVNMFDPRNKDELPGLNFAFHCGTPVNAEHPILFRCPQIENGIKECQSRGKKVAISLGGATGNGLLASAERARTLANNIWQLFLGGSGMGFDALRPFGTAVLDGVDLDIEGGGKQHWAAFVIELRRLMNTDSSKSYIISGAPQCPYPDAWLGPSSGSALGDAGEHFDYLYVQFYNNFCSPSNRARFTESLDKWLNFANNRKPKGPRILIGLPAHPEASGSSRYFMRPAELRTIYKSVQSKAGVGGIMLWDLSWDQNNVINTRSYSEYAFDVLPRDPSVITTTKPIQSTESTTTAIQDSTTPLSTTMAPVTTATQDSTTPISTTMAPVTTATQDSTTPMSTTMAPVSPTTTGAFTCPSSGIFPHPFDSTKYIQCSEMGAVVRSCSPGLFFNKVAKVCHFNDGALCQGRPDGMYPNIVNLRKFIVCNHGLQFEMLCAFGTVFDPEKEACAYSA